MASTAAYFPSVKQISYEGPKSDNPLAFKYYDANRKVAGKTLRDHLKFAVCYWHSFCGVGADPFGSGTLNHKWDQGTDAMDRAKARLDAAFEFFVKLGAPYYCFHDRDMAPEGQTVSESEKNLRTMVDLAKRMQQSTGVKLLWGTANLFSHPRYMNGAATNPDIRVVAHAAAQVHAALAATVELGGTSYVFWGGREGYNSLLNTDMKREQDNLAQFLSLARDYGRKIGFKGDFLIEPKPMEPSKHQYDFDAATTIGFLRHYGLDKDFKLNIEANHATLANHTFAHELQVASDAGLLGSIDANRGDAQNGWDTDQFPTNVYDVVEAMMVILSAGGFAHGGINFDAKVRRNSTDVEDLFIGHIGAMDTFAFGLEVAANLIEGGALSKLRSARYQSFQSGIGREFTHGKVSLAQLRDFAADLPVFTPDSGKQELVENIVNQYLFGRALA
ncbi:MAG: xylose isomerase [Pseudomonadota bacterium]|jgi:xylose isomerase